MSSTFSTTCTHISEELCIIPVTRCIPRCSLFLSLLLLPPSYMTTHKRPTLLSPQLLWCGLLKSSSQCQWDVEFNTASVLVKSNHRPLLTRCPSSSCVVGLDLWEENYRWIALLGDLWDLFPADLLDCQVSQSVCVCVYVLVNAEMNVITRLILTKGTRAEMWWHGWCGLSGPELNNVTWLMWAKGTRSECDYMADVD